MNRPIALITGLTLLGLGGCSSSTGPDDGEVPSTAPPLIEFFVASDDEVQHGDYTLLRWKAEGATMARVTPDGGIGADPNSGSVSVRPPRPMTYTLAVFNDFGSDSAVVSVNVSYYTGIYVDSRDGDDSRTGESPNLAVKTLSEALARSQGSGAIYLTGGDYPVNVELTANARRIYGGLDPETFFESPDFESRIVPAAGVPLAIHDVVGPMVISNLTLVAPLGADAAATVENVQDPLGGFEGLILQDCRVLGLEASGGTALHVSGRTDALVQRSWIRGPRGGSLAETAGLTIEDDARVVLRNCFVDGGLASFQASGVRVDVTGGADIRIGLNSIGAGINTNSGIGIGGAAVRVFSGAPAIGGNILFGTGIGPTFGVVEESEDADPVALYGNLFIGLGVTPYDDYPSTEDPMSESDLNDRYQTVGLSGITAENILFEGANMSNIFRDLPEGDFHLKPTLPGGAPNPAIDALNPGWAIASDQYGGVRDDVDGASRPGSTDRYDLGADEL